MKLSTKHVFLLTFACMGMVIFGLGLALADEHIMDEDLQSDNVSFPPFSSQYMWVTWTMEVKTSDGHWPVNWVYDYAQYSNIQYHDNSAYISGSASYYESGSNYLDEPYITMEITGTHIFTGSVTAYHKCTYVGFQSNNGIGTFSEQMMY